MSFKINTNIPAMNAGVNSSQNSANLNKSLGALSSGSNLSKAAFDAASLAIADKLMSQVSGLGQDIMNSNDNIGMLQIADGAMQGINDNTDRIRTLTLQASNGTLSSSNRATIQKEIDGLMQSSNHIANSTSYNGISLLNGAGPSVTSGVDARGSALFSSPVDVTTQASANASIDTIDKATSNIGDIRSTLGATQNQLESHIRNISLTQVNEAAAQSQLKDVDFASESANFTKDNMMSQIGAFVQSQANISASHAMSLLQ
jgi:flagellin